MLERMSREDYKEGYRDGKRFERAMCARIAGRILQEAQSPDAREAAETIRNLILLGTYETS